MWFYEITCQIGAYVALSRACASTVSVVRWLKQDFWSTSEIKDGCWYSGPCVNWQMTKNYASSNRISSLIVSLLLLFIVSLWITSETQGRGRETWVRDVSHFTYPIKVAIEGKENSFDRCTSVSPWNTDSCS